MWKQIWAWAHTITAVLVLAASSPTPSQPPVQSRPTPASNETEIAALIRQLGSNSFQQREAASRRLLAISTPAVRPVHQARWDPDPEIRHRVRFLLDQLPEAHFADDEGFLRAWLVLLPLPFGEGATTGAASLNRPQVTGEAGLRLRPEDKVEVGGYSFFWKKYTPESYRMDFNQFLDKKKTKLRVCYAVAYVESEKERKNLKLKIGSDDQCKVYLNGELVHRSEKERSLRKDEDVVAGITLKKGINVVVFKIVNEEEDWGGCLRFCDRDDKPVTDLLVTLKP